MERAIQSELMAWKSKPGRQPLILRGARQVGKTYALKAFGEKAYPRTFYLNFEEEPQLMRLFEKDLKPDRLIREIGLKFETSLDPDRDLLIFDEIQSAPKALTSLKYFAEDMPQLSVCSGGSLLGVHLGEGSFPVGKVDFLDLHPMSFDEFLTGIGEEHSCRYLRDYDFSEPIPALMHDRLWESLKLYMIVGGMPKSVLTYVEMKKDAVKAFNAVRQIQKLLIDAYLADIAKHAGKVNTLHIARIFESIPEQLAKAIDGSGSKFKFNGVVPGIRGYAKLVGAFDWLRAAGLVRQVPIANKAWIPLKAYAPESSFKLYLLDVGILGALGSLSPSSIWEYGYGSYQGYFAENLALQELVASGTDNIVSWREGTAEVEFLIDVDGKIVPLEIKSGWVTQAKSLKVFAEKYRPPKRVTLSAKNFNRNRETCAYTIPLYLAGRVRQILDLP